MRLKNKVGIVTGGAAGIGRGIALAMAKEGAHIAIVDINEENGQKTLEELNSHAEGMLLIEDSIKKEDIVQIVVNVVDYYSKLDSVVNNAHAVIIVPMTEKIMGILA